MTANELTILTALTRISDAAHHVERLTRSLARLSVRADAVHHGWSLALGGASAEGAEALDQLQSAESLLTELRRDLSHARQIDAPARSA